MLTAAGIRSLKPADKPYKRFDEKGLYLLVKPNGARLWRFKYRIHGRENHLALGAYPDVGLRRARDKRDEARKLVAKDVDRAARRRSEKRSSSDTLEAIAREWLSVQADRLADATYQKARQMFEAKIFPHLGNRPINKVDAQEVLQVLRRIESQRHYETAHRCRQRLSQVFRYAVATGRCDTDPTLDLRGALEPVVARSGSAIADPGQVGELLRSISAYSGSPVTRAALRLMALTFVRPVELRRAEWSEVDLDDALWHIPAERTKMKREHLVPLSDAAVEVFRELRPLTGHRTLVFESLRPGRPLSENTMNVALRNMGYSGDVMTAHGFRALASTLLHEQGWPPEVIELQFARARNNQVGAAYDRSARIEERKRMMRAWADYLSALRKGATIVPILTDVYK